MKEQNEPTGNVPELGSDALLPLRIAHFEKKGGILLWREDFGNQASYVGEPQDGFLRISDGEIFRWADGFPTDGFIRVKYFLG